MIITNFSLIKKEQTIYSICAIYVEYDKFINGINRREAYLKKYYSIRDVRNPKGINYEPIQFEIICNNKEDYSILGLNLKKREYNKINIYNNKFDYLISDLEMINQKIEEYEDAYNIQIDHEVCFNEVLNDYLNSFKRKVYCYFNMEMYEVIKELKNRGVVITGGSSTKKHILNPQHYRLFSLCKEIFINEQDINNSYKNNEKLRFNKP
jgi:hypothetical protein